MSATPIRRSRCSTIRERGRRFPNASNAGFRFALDTTSLTNGEHRLAVRIFDARGNSTVLGTRTIQVQNHLLAIATNELPKGKKGEFYNYTLQAANDRPPFVWTIASGTFLFLMPVAVFTFALRRHLLRGVTFGAIRK